MPPKKKAAATKKAEPKVKKTADEAPVADSDTKVEKVDEPEADTAEPQNQRDAEISQPDEQPVEPNTNDDDAKPTAKAEEAKTETKSTESKKRKAPPAPAREGSRKSGRGNKFEPSTPQLLNFLLSKQAEDLCRPEDEQKALGSSKDIRTYSSILNPYEELLCAVILSRPISHMLGMRTIRTILNDPYSFTSAKKTQEAGSEQWHKAVWDAKTQHKDKTAQQIGGTAEAVLSQFTLSEDKEGTQLGKVLENEDVDAAMGAIKNAVKGFGPTSMDIFLRRVQWLWKHAFPYIDGKSADSLRDLGLPMNAEELERLVNENWKSLDKGGIAGDDEATKKRRAFTVIVERATGAVLENKLQQIKEAAASA